MLKHRGEQILARFPGPVTVTPVLTIFRGLSLAGYMLVAIVALWSGVGRYLEDPDSDWAPGVVGGAIFALLTVNSLVALRTNRITLDREGFEIVLWGIRGALKKGFPWREVSALEVVRVRSRTYLVSFDDARKKGDGMLSRVGRRHGYRNSTLLEDYGLGEDQFADLLNHWRDRALAKVSGDHGPTAP